ncbi:MAG: UDP-N-acetylmuramoyl-L-alanine--D-glutamate ligase, partial [Eubacteriales bacterium]
MKNSGRGEEMKENRMTLESYLESIRSKTVAVIGIGISNMPLLELLCHAGIAVTACDRKSRDELGKTAEKLQSLGVTLQLGE